ncbi:YHYH protein [Colwellia echini]|uniref:YHYH protein n=1 Tax=Colwellia echini TaxID=1982103 RepID=A0ABY3MZG1_9GAMM|nr:YHYH protein [Colwellia echini]TYK66620.1 YHYH protein [Colwellia echini]
MNDLWLATNHIFTILLLCFIVTSCGGESSDTEDMSNSTTTTEVTTETETNVTTNTDYSDVWVINTTGSTSTHILDSSTNLGVLENIQAVTEVSFDGKTYTVVTSEGIPKYDVTVTQDVLDALNSRPKVGSDFISGAPTVELGDVIKFGQDIGYSSNKNCTTDYGYGYWPPGPDCPTDDNRTSYFPVTPTATTEVCENGLGKVGLWVNGSSIYNWGDGQSYNSEGSWQTLAPVAEFYDVDVCGGHAANGDYHFHFYSSCLAELVGDKGDEHSPIYGFAADGYPVYGPWQAKGELAVSTWVTRDYSDNMVGCSDGKRSCALVDQYDITQGTETVTNGPDFDETVSTLSGNSLVTTNGYYYEDYYWDSTLTAQGGVYLDQYNGHTDTKRGYHYHITLSKKSDDSLVAAFPYIIGTRFAGELEDNALASCSSGNTSGLGGGRTPR